MIYDILEDNRMYGVCRPLRDEGVDSKGYSEHRDFHPDHRYLISGEMRIIDTVRIIEERFEIARVSRWRFVAMNRSP